MDAAAHQGGEDESNNQILKEYFLSARDAGVELRSKGELQVKRHGKGPQNSFAGLIVLVAMYVNTADTAQNGSQRNQV